MKPKDIGLGVLVTLIWGINFSAIEIGVSRLDPFVLVGLRFAICSITVVPFVRRPDVCPLYVVAYGLLFGVGLWGIATLGIELGLSAGIASLVLQSSAFLSVILGWLAFGEKLSFFKVLGMIICAAGLGCIATITDGSMTIPGLLLVLLAAFFWSLSNIIVKKSGSKDIISFLIWSSLVSPLPLFALAYLRGGSHVFEASFHHMDGRAIISLLFQCYPTTVFGYWAWNWLLRKYPVSTVAPLSLLVPIFGMSSALLIFGEDLSPIKLLAMSLIVIGLIVGLYGNRLGLIFAERRHPT